MRPPSRAGLQLLRLGHGTVARCCCCVIACRAEPPQRPWTHRGAATFCDALRVCCNVALPAFPTAIILYPIDSALHQFLVFFLCARYCTCCRTLFICSVSTCSLLWAASLRVWPLFNGTSFIVRSHSRVLCLVGLDNSKNKYALCFGPQTYHVSMAAGPCLPHSLLVPDVSSSVPDVYILFCFQGPHFTCLRGCI